MASYLPLEIARAGPPADFPTEESLLTFVNADGSTALLKLAPLSSASRYHLDSLLGYGQVETINSTVKVSSKPKAPMHQNAFTLYKNLPGELRLSIWKMYIRANPRKIMLRMLPNDHFISVDTKYPAPIQLHVNRDIRSDCLKLHGYTKFKHPSHTAGVTFNPEVDMLILDSHHTGEVSARYFEDVASGSEVLDRIRCIGISFWLLDFDDFIKSFKNYPNLELVFVVIARLTTIPTGTVEKDMVSKEGELVFEVFDTRASSNECDWFQIPRIDAQTGRFEGKYKNFLRDLYLRMARVGGVTPQVRFVRAVKGMKQH